MNDSAKALRRLRYYHGMTRQGLAAATGISIDRLTAIEIGGERPTEVELQTLVGFFFDGVWKDKTANDGK